MYLLWKHVLGRHGYASIDDMDIGEQLVALFHLLGVTLCWFMLFVAMCGAMGLAAEKGAVSTDSGLVVAYGLLFFMGYIQRQVEMWGLPIIVGIMTLLCTFDIKTAGLYTALTFFFFGPALCLLEYTVIFLLSFGLGFKVGSDGEVSAGEIGKLILLLGGLIWICTTPLRILCELVLDVALAIGGSKANLTNMSKKK